MQRTAQDPGDECGQEQQGADDFAHRVGFADIADHFGGIDQIVDGDEVEAGAEFVPENPFRNADKEQREDINGKQRPTQPTSPFGAEKQFEEQPRRGGDSRHRQVAQGADRQRRQQVAMLAHRRHRDPVHLVNRRHPVQGQQGGAVEVVEAAQPLR